MAEDDAIEALAAVTKLGTLCGDVLRMMIIRKPTALKILRQKWIRPVSREMPAF